VSWWQKCFVIIRREFTPKALATVSQQYLCRQPAIWVIEEKKRLKTIEGMGFCEKRVHAKIFNL
jgi:hypothetical protein